MSDEEEEFNDEEADAIEDEPDAEGDEEDEEMGDEQEQEDGEGDEDEDENSESSQEASDAEDEEEGSSGKAEESGDDAMDEDEPQASQDSPKTKSPRVMKRDVSKLARESSTPSPRRSTSPASIRREMLRVPPPQVRSYTIEPVCAIPHPSPTNAMAASLCMSHLLTGSDDGYIRDYDVFTAVNGRVYLTAPQRSHCGLGDTLMRAGVLRSWWPAATQENFDADRMSPVYSMACHSDALWALSGSATGEINLYTVRHEPGKVHYTFTEHHAAVSALALSSDEKSVFSGSHDGHALQLDLDRGTVARKFNHPGAQITALGLKPFYPFTLPDTDIFMTSPVRTSQEETKPGIEGDEDKPHVEDSPVKELPPSTPPEEDNNSDGYDPLFDDDDANGSANQSPKNTQQSSGAPGLSLPGRSRAASAAEPIWPMLPTTPPMKHGVRVLDPVKYMDFSNDLLMTATFGGSLFLWDRRAAGNVGRLENHKAPPWCISACWSATGNEILAGRRNATVDVFDVRQFGGSSMQNPRVLRTLVNPGDSKTVTCVAAFPDGKHMVCASEDNIRLWNVHEAPVEGWKKKGLPPFRVIPGHHGGLVSQIIIDIRSQFMVTASSARQWPGQSTKTVLIHDIRNIY